MSEPVKAEARANRQRSLTRLIIRALIFLVLLLALLLLPLPGLPLDLSTRLPFASAQSAADGEALFKEKCFSCHTIGQGDRVGPDLAGVTGRRDRDWLRRFILAPDRMIAEGDPIATELLRKYKNVPMPDLGLTEAEVAALIAFLESQEGAPAPATEAAPTGTEAAVLPEGDAAVGKNLFTGADRFENGGPPCLSCHSVAGIGALGGGALGPDLTQAYARYGGEGLAPVLADLPFPTMRPIFEGQPLTEAEVASLVAFLVQAAASERPASALWKLLLLALGGAAVLMVGAGLVWRRRLTAVRELLLRRAPRRRE